MKNRDKVDLKKLEPNEDDILGWKDRTTGKNYWLVEQNEYVQVAPMVPEDIIEIRPMPVKNECEQETKNT